MKPSLVVLLLIGFFINVSAQDVEGSKDPSLFERLPGFTIYDYTVTNFGGYQFCNEEGDNIIIEGMITFYYYETDGEVDPKKIVDKFSQAVLDKGGKVYGKDPGQKYMFYRDNNKLVWVDLFAEDFYYTLNIIEKWELISEISAVDLLAKLQSEGSATLYFNFDKDNCVIKEECKPVLEMLAEVLNSDPSMLIHVTGYTDDIGRSDNNLTLSANRAKALVDKLVERGIDEERLTWEGSGEKDPIADNSTLEGRTMNNRIVLIMK